MLISPIGYACRGFNPGPALPIPLLTSPAFERLCGQLANNSITEFTVLLYLSDSGLEGGETIFYGSHGAGPRDEILRFKPKRGTALVHAHGTRCLTHEGAAVTAGTKYLLRTDLCYGGRAGS